MKDIITKEFGKVYGDANGVKTYFAPGRVNLIGEHTDYNGGHVFPCALTIGTYAAVKERTDKKVRFYSMNFESNGIIEADLNEKLTPKKEQAWTNYPLGVIWAFEERGMKLTHGFDMLINGNIPNSSGLSSSASLEVLTGFVLKEMFGFNVTNPFKYVLYAFWYLGVSFKLLIVLRAISSFVIIPNTGVPFSINEIVPCFNSPAGYASE